jgi:hypothetical protein
VALGSLATLLVRGHGRNSSIGRVLRRGDYRRVAAAVEERV